MSPRISPRPEYPPFIWALTNFVKEVFVQGGGHGIAVTLLLYPFYLWTRKVAGQYGVDDKLYFCIMTSLTHSVLYIICNVGFYIMDQHNFMPSYKLARKPHQTPKPALMRKMLFEAFIGQAITGPLFAYLLYPLFLKFGMMPFSSPLPDVPGLFKTFVAGHLFNDVGFYLTHRLFHHKLLYKHFHKQHHEFSGTIGFAAEYANPVEVIVSNQIPTVGGVLFFGAHPLCVWVWIALRLQQTYEAHSGYCFEGHILDKLWILHSDSAAHHDHHHTANQGNFGGGWTDWLFGTMDHYMAMGGKEGYMSRAQ